MTEVERRLDNLEKRIARLEDREGYIMPFLDSIDDPWSHLVLESDFNREQRNGICDVMESTYQKLAAGADVTTREFENQMQPYMPDRPGEGIYNFIKGVLMVFARTGQWPDVVTRFRDSFNVPSGDKLALLDDAPQKRPARPSRHF